MGLNDLQSHIVQSIPESTEMVDILKLAQSRLRRDGPLKLVIDGECCLDRLYGGYYPDWVCGGQWNKMEQFLRNFSTAIKHNSNLELVIFFNGALEPDRMANEWNKKQEEAHKFLEEINKHVNRKKKPPPKCWWVPPTFLRSAVRLALRTLQMKVMCSLDDHHKDIVQFSKKHNFQGIIADDPEYLVFDTHQYFSAQKLKLTFKGSLETVEIKLKTVFDTLNLTKDRFLVFTALLGNHILSSEDDLQEFYTSLEIESPQTKATVIQKVAEFVKKLESTDPEKVGELIAKGQFEKDREKANALAEKVAKCLRYYSDVVTVKSPSRATGKKSKSKGSQNKENKTLPSETEKPENANNTEQGTSKTDDISTSKTDTSPKGKDQSAVEKLAYKISHQIENVAMSRHRSGLMSTYICQIFKYREIKLPIIIEDVKNTRELPRAHDVFRPLRSHVYAILFNLHHLHFLAKKNKEKVPSIQVKETVYCPETKTNKTIFVNAVEVFPGIPTVERLWLGDGDECKRKRIRAFLTIMKSDKDIVLSTAYVPQEFIVLVCVLRYILTHEKFLRRNELDALLAQGLISDMTDANVAQDIEVKNLTMRGVSLSQLFMEGVEMALFANDACGSPIPFLLFCPWLFFNGKIFNFILEQQEVEGKTLAEICGYKMELLCQIEKLRAAVFEGIDVQFAPESRNPFLIQNDGLINQIKRQPDRPSPYNIHPMNYSNNPHQLSNILASQGSINNPPFLIGGGHRSVQQRPMIPNCNNMRAMNGPQQHPLLNQLPPHYHGQINRNTGGIGGHGLISNLPNMQSRQRKVMNGGGQLEVGGIITSSWGPSISRGNGTSLLIGPGPFGRNVRSSMGNFMQPNLTSLYGQEIQRISRGGNKNGHISRNGNPTQMYQKKTGKNQVGKKKSIMKKPGETSNNTSKSGTNGNVNSGAAAKVKGVQFKEEISPKKSVSDDDTNVKTLNGEKNLVANNDESNDPQKIEA